MNYHDNSARSPLHAIKNQTNIIKNKPPLFIMNYHDN